MFKKFKKIILFIFILFFLVTNNINKVFANEDLEEIKQKSLNYGLNEILKLNPSIVTRINDNEVLKKDIILPARDTSVIIPEVMKIENEDDGEEMEVDYEKIIPVLIKAIQEQNLKFKNLEDKIINQDQEKKQELNQLIKKDYVSKQKIFYKFHSLDRLIEIVLITLAFLILAYFAVVVGFTVTFASHRDTKNEVKKIRKKR